MAEETTLVVNLPGGKQKEFDISDPEQKAKAIEQISKGYGFEDKSSEYNALKNAKDELQKQLTYWEGLIADARETEDSSKVLAALEMAGLKVKSGTSDDVILDQGSEEVSKLQKEIDDLKNIVLSRANDEEHRALESKYGEKYDRKAVEEYANKRGVVHLEDAFKLLNMDTLKKDEIDEIERKYQDKLSKLGVKPPGSGGAPPKPPTVHKSYDEATKAWLADVKAGIAESPFDED